MKVKRILCLLILLALTVSFAGCARLDEMRQRQGFLIDGNVHWNGAVYKPLPENAEFSPTWGYQNINVTLPDVPVLLSTSFRVFDAGISKDGLFLCFDTYYCREDVYDVWAARMREPFDPQVLGYYYFYWDEETGEGGDAFYVLTEEQEAALNTVLQTVEPMVIGEGWSLDYVNRFGLETATEDLMFRRSAQIDIAQAGQQYYLIEYRFGSENVYQIPVEYNGIFGDLVEKYMKYW